MSTLSSPTRMTRTFSPSKRLRPKDLESARRSLASFAAVASYGQWIPYRHHLLICQALTQVARGQLTHLMIEMPPRHGKSEMVSKYFPAWYLGLFPWRHILFGSYGFDFAAEWGRKVRDVLADWGPDVFGVSIDPQVSAAHRWELAGFGGGMQCAGVDGPFTGKGGQLLIVDDPIKTPKEALSPTVKRAHQDWFDAALNTRLTPEWTPRHDAYYDAPGAVILMMTRWAEDDLAGWLEAKMQTGGAARQWTILRLPAIAETVEDFPGWHREPGEALWPEQYPLAWLTAIREDSAAYWWHALYQQRPQPPEGMLAKREWFPILPVAPACVKRHRHWDFAATERSAASHDPDWTVGTLMGLTADKRAIVEHVLRGRFGPGEVERVVLQTAQTDGRQVSISFEREPAASGKLFASHLTRLLTGYTVRSVPPQGDKVTAGMPLMSQAEAGHVALVAGPWNRGWLDEICAVPNAPHDDQWDSAAGAFNALCPARPGTVYTA